MTGSTFPGRIRPGACCALNTRRWWPAFCTFRDLDWKPVAVAIARLEAEKRRLEAASDLLKALTAQLTALENELRETEGQLKERNNKRSKAERKSSDARYLQHQAQVLLAETAYPRRLACGAAAQQAKKPA